MCARGSKKRVPALLCIVLRVDVSPPLPFSLRLLTDRIASSLKAILALKKKRLITFVTEGREFLYSGDRSMEDMA